MTRLAIFDCDGTLVDSGATIYEALGLTFAERGLAVPPPHVGRRVIGLSLVEAMAGLMPDSSRDDHFELAEKYKKHFIALRAAGRVEEPLYPGILDLLDALEEHGFALAVATGKSDRGLKHCLDAHGLRARFVSLQTSDRHPSKPHPSMIHQALADSSAEAADTLMIGDTSFDMAMAVAAGAVPVGVAWGYHEPAELIDAGAVTVAETPRDILEFALERSNG
ncbi:MAG: HAD-IA family hydrolase [Sphingomicrobium sp.]